MGRFASAVLHRAFLGACQLIHQNFRCWNLTNKRGRIVVGRGNGPYNPAPSVGLNS